MHCRLTSYVVKTLLMNDVGKTWVFVKFFPCQCMNILILLQKSFQILRSNSSPMNYVYTINVKDKNRLWIIYDFFSVVYDKVIFFATLKHIKHWNHKKILISSLMSNEVKRIKSSSNKISNKRAKWLLLLNKHVSWELQ